MWSRYHAEKQLPEHSNSETHYPPAEKMWMCFLSQLRHLGLTFECNTWKLLIFLFSCSGKQTLSEIYFFHISRSCQNKFCLDIYFQPEEWLTIFINTQMKLQSLTRSINNPHRLNSIPRDYDWVRLPVLCSNRMNSMDSTKP